MLAGSKRTLSLSLRIAAYCFGARTSLTLNGMNGGKRTGKLGALAAPMLLSVVLALLPAPAGAQTDCS